MSVKQRLRHYLTIILVQAAILALLGLTMNGLKIQSMSGAVGVAVLFIGFQFVFWWLFIHFFSRLPVWIYPLATFALSGGIFMALGNLIPGILIADFQTSLWVTIILSSLNAALAGILILDIDSQFDKYVTSNLVKRVGSQIKTDKPGFLFLEIDGLSEKTLRQAIEREKMPTLAGWIDRGSHMIAGWETDFTSQTGAMQAGILLGRNDEIPAYRWWDRDLGRVVKTGSAQDAAWMEARLSTGEGLLSGGGASRGNIFSGDAQESLFTFSTLLHPGHNLSPGFYMYLINPFMIARLVTRFILRVMKEWGQGWIHRLQKKRRFVRARNFRYAFLRAAAGPLLEDLTTFTAISDILRGLPAIYAQFTEYDDLSHVAGESSPEAFQTLEEIDRYIARFERAVQLAPRPFYIIVLSDHGQSSGPSFASANRVSFDQWVRSYLDADVPLVSGNHSSESWDKVNALLSESIHADTRTAHILQTMLRGRTHGGLVSMEPKDCGEGFPPREGVADHPVAVLASGCAGLIYFTDARQRLTMEEIQMRCPNLILGLVSHPGIGFLLLRSRDHGDIVLGRQGIYFLDQNNWEGSNPLEGFPPNAGRLLARESSFRNCPDILVHASFNPATGVISSFENQISHHGGLGGEQSFPFLLYPSHLPIPRVPLVGAEQVNRLLMGWRRQVQRDV